jgi:hypothetical protein
MRRHASHGRRLTRGPRRRHRRRVADLPGRRVRPGRQGADLSDAHLATGEGAEAMDGATRARVVRSPTSNSDNVRSAQSAAHTASTRRSSSLSVNAPCWRPMSRILATADPARERAALLRR